MDHGKYLATIKAYKESLNEYHKKVFGYLACDKCGAKIDNGIKEAKYIGRADNKQTTRLLLKCPACGTEYTSAYINDAILELYAKKQRYLQLARDVTIEIEKAQAKLKAEIEKAEGRPL